MKMTVRINPIVAFLILSFQCIGCDAHRENEVKKSLAFLDENYKDLLKSIRIHKVALDDDSGNDVIFPEGFYFVRFTQNECVRSISSGRKPKEMRFFGHRPIEINRRWISFGHGELLKKNIAVALYEELRIINGENFLIELYFDPKILNGKRDRGKGTGKAPG